MSLPATALRDDPLAGYTPASSFFASPTRTVLTAGGRAEPVAADVPFAVGALPFDPTAPAHLVVPRSVRQAPRPRPAEPSERPVPGAWELRPDPPAAQYRAAVAAAVRRMSAGEADKVVLARSLRLDSADPIDRVALLHRLAAANPAGYLFAVPLPGNASRVLLGATPELLVARDGRTVTSHPLAGSRPRGADPAADGANAAELLASAKDHAEHRVVTEAIADVLLPYCPDLRVPAEPSLVDTPTMWHLGTRIEGTLTDPDVSSLSLARALHPTPAVCGRPAPAARRVIGELEPFDRGFFTGAVGWTDWTGDGEWVVAIRCAEVGEHDARLYAGAGLVTASDPAAELAETSAKFRTFLAALGLDGAAA